MEPEVIQKCPTLGDMRAALQRLIDRPTTRMSARLADAIIVRDWLEHAKLYMRCQLKREAASVCPSDPDSLLLRLLDDRETTGRPEPPPAGPATQQPTGPGAA